ncbi:MAG: helix-turn-helix domain-containing protein [Gammaproteobacteria bacterium]|nr:helix-turn-helix domain-containing protein [Gammaproteobacteria bacterium]
MDASFLSFGAKAAIIEITMSTYSLTNSWLSALVRAVETYNIDPHDLLVGELQTDDLSKPVNARIDHDAMTRMWRRASVITNDPAIGLVAAGFVGPATFGSVSFAMNASDCTSTALRALVRYSVLGSNAATWTFRQDEKYVELTQKMRGPIGASEQKDANAAGILHICRSLGDPRLRYEKLVIGRPAPKDISRWREHFSLVPEFQDNGISFMRFSREAVDERWPNYEPELFELSISILERKLKQVGKSSFLAQVKGQIIEGLEQGNIHIDLVADKLGISRRTLQRRLWTESHYTYSNLFQAVRRSLANRYLLSSSRSVEEISDLLGYSNVSSFSRSFRQGFGTTPTEYRRQTSSSDTEILESIGPL